MFLKLKELKYNIKWKYQRMKKGYCDNDLFSIDAWFINIFPKMLDEFVENLHGCPCNEKDLQKTVEKFPTKWKEEQKPRIDKIYEDKDWEKDEDMINWILIILRMKYCFEHLDEWHEDYEELKDRFLYEEISKKIEKYKKEGFKLLEKYFFNLWD